MIRKDDGDFLIFAGTAALTWPYLSLVISALSSAPVPSSISQMVKYL
jgi:hypothetical protein